MAELFLAVDFFAAAFFGAALAELFLAVDFLLTELFVEVFFFAVEDFLPLPAAVDAVFFFAVDFVVTLLLFAAPDALAVLTAMALPGRHKGPVSSLFQSTWTGFGAVALPYCGTDTRGSIRVTPGRGASLPK